MTHRQSAVAEQIRHVLSNALLFDMHNPLLKGTTITRIKLSPDGQYVDVRFTHMDDAKGSKALVAALEKATGALRREIARKVRLKRVPELRFHFDEDVAQERRIGEILHDLNIPESDDHAT